MIKLAEHHKEMWYNAMRESTSRSDRAECVRNYNALRGVIKSLMWVAFNGEEPLR
jgi:hypothetical protein